MTETDQPQPVIVANDHEIHIRLGGLPWVIHTGDTVVINAQLYLPLYEVLAREIVKRDEVRGLLRRHQAARAPAGGAPPPQQMPLARQIEIGARVESLERSIQQLRSNVDANLTTRISKLESDTTSLSVSRGHQGDVNAEHRKAISELSVAVAGLDRAAPPELASLVELVTGQQDQIDKLQAMLEPRIPAGVVDGRPVAGPEIGIALDGEIDRAIDRHDLATRTHVDEAIRRLAATIRQYVRDQVQQALRRRPSALRRVWDALADRGAPSAPAPAPEPAAVPPAIAEMAEQALRRGR